MAIFYVAYKGGWQQGEKTYLAFLDPNDSFSTANAISNSRWFSDPSGAISFNSVFDQTVTYICINQATEDFFKSIGFMNAKYFSERTDFYISPTKFIRIEGSSIGYYTDSSTLSFSYAIDTDPYIRSYGTRAISLLSPNIKNTSNVYRSVYIGIVKNNYTDLFSFIYTYNSGVPGDTLNNYFTDIEPFTPPTDPYEEGGGSSSIGGGTGTFSETGDIVGIPGLPTLSAVDTGFITLFNPTATQVKQLAAYMWSNSFDMATFKNIVANPIDCILGLTIVPVDPPNAGTKAVSVGNIATDVNMPYLSSQYVEVDCGTLNVQEFWGSYLDYSPYTKMSLYLPYIGIVPLDIDDVMNATITIKYHVDVLSGACVAYVLCNGTQLYTYIGQCSSNVPITSNDFTNTVNGILGIAGSIGSLVATGGASAPTEIGKIAGNAINALKPNIQKSGAMSGTGGLMGVQTPYLICQRPRQSVPASQNSFTGYPSNITATLSDLSGYTEVDKIHLEGVPCTNEEMDEIMTLLESGVYI